MNIHDTVYVIATILGALISFATLFAIISYGRAQWKKGANEALIETIAGQRGLIETREKEISDIKCDLGNALDQIKKLEARVLVIEKQKTTFQDLILSALDHYFLANPEAAAKMAITIKRSEKNA